MRISFILLISFLFSSPASEGQNPDPAWQSANHCVQEYIQLSRLGPGYSRNISPDIIEQFRALFEKDAFLYWDLYKSVSDSVLPPLPADEYIGRAMKLYDPKQPLLAYPDMRIRVQEDGRHAVVYLKKVNKIADTEDNLLNSITINLQLHINLTREKPLIQNIFKDEENPPVRSISVGVNYCPWSNIIHSIASNPVLLIGSNEHFAEFNVTPGIAVQYGAMLEMNINRASRGGLTFSTGVFYANIPLHSSMIQYAGISTGSPDKKAVRPIAFTTGERSPEVSEKIVVSKIEIPLLLKSYLTDWLYIKGGTAIGYVTGTSHIYYVLNEDKIYHFPKEKFLNKVVMTIQLSAGFEKQFDYFSFGLEPNFSFGMNPLSTSSHPGNYQLTSISNFHSILESMKMPAFEFAVGIRFLFSYVFKN